MKLIIHIGTEKTGSSSLQQWGAKNREHLKEDGVFYSQSLGNIDHRKASVYARLAHLPDDGFQQYGINTQKEHASFCKQVERELSAEVALAKRKNARVFLISSEHFHSRVTNKEMIDRLNKLVSPHFDEIEILAYLRPQAELFQSRLSVGVRNMTHSQAEVDGLWKNKNEITYFDYHLLWHRWNSSFKNVTFKPFNKNKDIVKDVAESLDIELEKYSIPERVNEKLDYKAGAVSYHIKKYINLLKIDKRLIDTYQDDCENKEPITISRNLVAKINDYYRESNLNFCKANSDFTLVDVEAELEKFPVDGTADKMFLPNKELEFVVPILVRQSLESFIFKCEKKILMVERAHARGNVSNADKFRSELVDMLLQIENLNIPKERFWMKLADKINALAKRLDRIN